jgi:hypothetical protein
MSTKALHEIDVHAVEYHRNGIGGEPFYACHFTDPDCDGQAVEFIATVFAPRVDVGDDLAFGEPGWHEAAQARGFHNPFVAVLAVEQLPNVRFGENSWRGDNYADALYRAIEGRV